jgi:hypothetical protein
MAKTSSSASASLRPMPRSITTSTTFRCSRHVTAPQ